MEGCCDRVREEEEEIELLTTVPSFRACVWFPSWGSFVLEGLGRRICSKPGKLWARLSSSDLNQSSAQQTRRAFRSSAVSPQGKGKGRGTEQTGLHLHSWESESLSLGRWSSAQRLGSS